MPGFSPQAIFLSYRRDDTGPSARLLQRDLKQRFPGAPIFMDVDSIEAGLDFAEVIEERVNSCAVLVALIGRQWATLTDEDGARRLDNPDDYVRFEVKTALERGVRVIPVLVDGARPLRQQELPAELHKLARLNAHKLSWDRYQYDADQLLDLIQRVRAAAGGLAEADRKAREEADRESGEGELPVPVVQAKSSGEAEEAGRSRDYYARRLPITEAVLGAEHLDTLEIRARLAGLTGAAGDPAAARDQYATLLPVYERLQGAEDPGTLRIRAHLVRWTGEAGDPAGASDQYQALLSVIKRVLGPDHPDTRTARSQARYWAEKAEADRKAQEEANRKAHQEEADRKAREYELRRKE